MIINSQNIEKWFFDYFEGELTVLERKELEQFVLNHPEYQDDFKSWSEAYTNDSDIPAYIAPVELYAKVAFYETATFRVAASILTLVMLSSIGYWSFRELSTNSVEDKSITYFKKDYTTQSIQPYSFSFLNKLSDNGETSSFNNSIILFDPALNGNIVQTIPAAALPDPIGVERNLQTSIGNSKVGQSTLGIVEENKVTSSLEDNLRTVFKLKKSTKLLTEANQDRDIKRSDSYELKFLQKERNYKFLDYRNSSVRGVSTLIKDEREKSSNVAEISESEGSKSNVHSKKSLAEKIRKLNLGLTNINDPIFEIANYQPLTLNPSLAGQLGFTRLKSFYRNQWLGTQHNTQIGGISIDSYVNRLRAGVALNAQTNIFNSITKVSTASFVYSQKFELKKEQSISATIEYTLMNVLVDETNVSNSIEFAPGLFLSESRLNQLKQKDVWHNLSVSSFYNGKYFYGGLNVSNLLGNSLTTNEQNNPINNLNYSIQLGTDYKKSFYSNFVIAPYVVFNKFGDQKECWLGTSLRYKGLIVGATGSTAKSGKVFGGFQSAKFRLVYGFDMNKSDALGTYFGNHEISFRILLGSKYNNWSR